MNINRHNCEAVFLDYYEKNLSPVEVAEVLFFLEENPELKEVFESYEAICLEHEKINFPDKESIKKKYSGEEISAILSSDITRTNCEQFFIANAEGILSSNQKEKLNLFLLQYPELKKEYELFLQCKLSAEKIYFEGKESLKKELITKENREEYFVRSVENDLNLSEQNALNIFLAKNPEYKKEFEIFSKTIFPVEVISFEGKSSLKKMERKPVFVSIFSQRATYYAAAAVILLLVGLFFIFKNDGTEKQILADKTNPANKIIVNVKKENVETPVKENEPNIAPEKKIQNDKPSNNRTFEQSNVNIQKQAASNQKPEVKKEEIKIQPILFEDNQYLVAEKENEKPKMMEQEVIAEKKQEEKKENELNVNQAVVSVVTSKSNDEYQTLGFVARNKIRSVLGIKGTECEAEDKITVWDLAMAAKNGVQNLIGTKAVDVNKVCDGSADKVEYVFAAGNFEISRSVSK